MVKKRSKAEEFERLAQLDIGELYRLADRPSVDRGLIYFRDFAVESLSWDDNEGHIIAEVSGSAVQPYQVALWMSESGPEYRCQCQMWRRFGACKHGIAAMAALFAVLKGVNLGGRPIPEDYLEELRDGLGVSGGFVKADSNVGSKPVDASIKVYEFASFGSMRLRVSGEIPGEFLRKSGVSLSSDYAGGFSREFVLKNIGERLPLFLEAAKGAGIPVRIRTSAGEVPLQLADEGALARLEFASDEKSVKRRVRFFDSDDEEILIEERVGSEVGLAPDGLVYKLESQDLPEPADRASKLVEAYEYSEFNRIVGAEGLPFLKGRPSASVNFVRYGVIDVPELIDESDLRLVLNGSIYKNAAGEPEALKYKCIARFAGIEIDLDALARKCLEPVLNAYSGGLLGTKRRVSGLLDLLRRVVADEGRDIRGRIDSAIRAFPMFEDIAYRGIVTALLRDFIGRIDELEGEVRAIAVEDGTGVFFAYPIPIRQLAMLLLSMSQVDTRRGLHELAGGAIPIKRGSSGSDVLQTMLLAAKALHVDVTIDDLPVRREKLSISVDARASGHDIDWFALHPMIACGEQTIDQVEWWRLLRGDLLIQAEDGSWVIPETEAEDTTGLRALADMMRVELTRGKKNREPMRVSRLQILDWIQLRRIGVQFDLPEEAEALFQSLLEFDELPKFLPSPRLNADLRPYQKEGCAWIDFLFAYRFGACLADDMGLGKTVQAIAFIQRHLEKKGAGRLLAPVLIVLPPSLVFNWREEWRRFAGEIKVAECLSKTAWAGALEAADVILTTYDRVRLDIREIRAVKFDIVVFDEAHNLKNVTAARTKAAVQLNRRFTLCLTGTPVENNASEFYSVMSAAVPGIFGSLKSFRDTFREDPNRILARARPFILRRTKSAILKELPAKEEHVLHLEMASMQKEIYTRTVAEVRDEIAKAFVDKPEQQAGILALAALLRLRQVCVSPTLLGKDLPEHAPKLAYMADKLDELRAEGHAALVFSQFLGGLDALESIAQERGIDYLRMDGSTPMKQREEIVQRFQAKDGPHFFFVSLKTGGVGLNLTRANYVFHLDPWWNPAVENQATDRAHRIGQEQKVFVQRLIMQHSIEARMMELKNRKAELFDQLVEQPGRQTASSGLSREDFEYLLEP